MFALLGTLCVAAKAFAQEPPSAPGWPRPRAELAAPFATVPAAPVAPPAPLPDDFANAALTGAKRRSFSDLPVLVELRGGVGTIVGLIGATASFDPWSRLALGAGFGANASGLQLAAFARLRPLVFLGRRRGRLHAVGVELGYSTGPFEDFLPPVGDGHGSTSSYEWDRVQWLQPQVTYETRSYGGFSLLAGVGVEIPIAKSGYTCLDTMLCTVNHISALPTVTIGMGHAFAL